MEKNNGLSKVFLGKGFYHKFEKMVAVVNSVITPITCHGSFGSLLIVSSVRWNNGGTRLLEPDCIVKGLCQADILECHSWL